MRTKRGRSRGPVLLFLAGIVVLLGSALVVLRGDGGVRGRAYPAAVPGTAVRVRLDGEAAPAPATEADPPEAPALQGRDPVHGSALSGAGSPAATRRASFPATLVVRLLQTEELGPMKGARVRARDLLGTLEGVTDAAGEIRFRGVEAGTTDLLLHDGERWSSLACITLPDGGRVEKTYEIHPLATLKCRVVSANDGRPVAGAWVRVGILEQHAADRQPLEWVPFLGGESSQEGGAEADSRGQCSVRGFFGGTILEVEVDDMGFHKSRIRKAVPPEWGTEVDLAVRLDPDGSAEGGGLDASASPVEDARVHMAEALELLPADSSIAEPRYDPEAIDLQPDPPATRQGRASVRLRFVAGESGVDPARTRLQWAPRDPTTPTFGDSLDFSCGYEVSKDGVLESAFLSPGAYTLHFHCPGAASGSRTFTLVPGRNDLGEIVLREGRLVTGRVLDSWGRALPGVVVRTDPHAWAGNWTVTRADGGFALKHVSEESTRISFSEDDHIPAAVALPEGAPGALGDTALLDGGILRVAARDADGHPLAGWRINLARDTVPPPDSSILDEPLDPQGRLGVRLPAGAYHLMLLRPEDEAIRGGLLSMPVRAEEGRDTPVEIRFPR